MFGQDRGQRVLKNLSILTLSNDVIIPIRIDWRKAVLQILTIVKSEKLSLLNTFDIKNANKSSQNTSKKSPSHFEHR